MKIHLGNIGPIKILDFELRRGLTLFCGPNSTGKTYAAYAMYSILKSMERWQWEWLTKEQLTTLKIKGKLSLDIVSIINSPEYLEKLSTRLNHNLGRDFAAPRDFFPTNCIRISDLANPCPDLDRKQHQVLGWGCRTFVAKNGKTLEVILENEPGPFDGNTDELLKAINREISLAYLHEYIPRVMVLTAERAAIQLFSSEILASRSGLVNDMLDLANAHQDSTNYSNIILGRARRYSSPINAGLAVAAELKTQATGTGAFANLANQLERSILGGQVHVGELGEVNYLPDGNNAALRIEMSASIIKSLASLVFYLRHQSQVGDVLIIDEPELNLHPDNQRKLARFLCELSNAGLDIIISTHSDYIIREVNNLILLNKPGLADVKTRHGYRDAELIKPEQVSVVLFNVEGLPQQIEIGKDGFSVISIDDEIDRMNRIAAEIMLESEE